MTGDSRPAREQCYCRIKDCGNIHSRTLFCCRPHWNALPKPLRDAVWRAYNGPDGVLGMEYAQAAEDAEAYLEGRPAEVIPI